MPNHRHSFTLPLPPGSAEVELNAHLKDVGLESDARAIWMGFPNLKSTSLALINWVGREWPSLECPSESAVFRAIANAVLEVRAGLERQETDRRYVVARFHDGLTVIAGDLTAYTAWGCNKHRALDPWTPFHERFDIWCQAHSFEKVIFAPKEKASELDRLGLVWKMRANIAPLHDVGVVSRFGNRSSL